MPKIPRDISGRELAKLLGKKFGYQIVREVGSHIRLNSNYAGREHKITIPDHSAIKIGTLNNVLKDISEYLSINKEELLRGLFE
jgi:predicted RNA binding protein YcfA (HicA-like mRNA interferase family)